MKYLTLCISSVVLAISAISSSATAQQPFSNTQTSPTVSPYLNLTTRNGGGNGFASYQTLVQPFLQQQQTNLQQQQQLQQCQTAVTITTTTTATTLTTTTAIGKATLASLDRVSPNVARMHCYLTLSLTLSLSVYDRETYLDY